MKKAVVCIAPVILFLFFGEDSLAQPKREYVSSKFLLEIDGPGNGYLKPVKKGDTLIYTLYRLTDSVLIRNKFDSAFGAAAKKYFLKYKLKKKHA